MPIDTSHKRLRPIDWLEYTNSFVPRLVIPVGPRFQADVPQWTGVSKEYSFCGDNELDTLKWLGTRIWPIEDEDAKIKEVIKEGKPNICSCTFPGSIECVKCHINEERVLLQSNLSYAFWTSKENNFFGSLMKRNPKMHGKSVDYSTACKGLKKYVPWSLIKNKGKIKPRVSLCASDQVKPKTSLCASNQVKPKTSLCVSDHTINSVGELLQHPLVVNLYGRTTFGELVRSHHTYVGSQESFKTCDFIEDLKDGYKMVLNGHKKKIWETKTDLKAKQEDINELKKYMEEMKVIVEDVEGTHKRIVELIEEAEAVVVASKKLKIDLNKEIYHHQISY